MVLIVALLACEEGAPPYVPATTIPEVEPGAVSMRRLTRAQYHNVVADLFGDGVVVPDLTEPDVSQGGLLSVGAADTTFSPSGVASMEAAAFSIAEQALEGEARRASLPCSPSRPVDPECSRAVLGTVGRSAWRRPLADDEVERLAVVADNAAEVLGDFYEGLAYGVAALLQSPNFVFRVELGEGGRFRDFELASRLSFFLWNTAPDEALLDAAAEGALATDEGLRTAALRLLASPRARTGIRSFFVEQLQLYELDALAKDPMVFEHFNTRLGPDAREETLRLLEAFAVEDVDFRDVMTTRRTFLNPRLAAVYDLPAPAREGFQEVTLPTGANRAGLLTHASLLNLHAHQVSSSATLRGKFARTVLLCQSIPPPPANVNAILPEPSGDKVTLRERVRIHLEDETCASCHLLTDPIGLGLENYDGIGRFRETEYGAPIDPSGELDGAPFADAVELGAAIRDHEAFAPCVVRTWVRYATGRVESPDETRALDALAARFAESGYRMRALLLDIVTSPVFLNAGAPR